MSILKALSKQLFGAKYERVVKSLIVCLILFLAISAAEIEMEIAPHILFLTATVVSAGIMWQALISSGNTDSAAGLFMMPFADREMAFSMVLAFTVYTMVTKTFLALSLFFAVHEWSALQIAVSFLCTWNGCFMAAAWYTMVKKRRLLPFAVLWCVGILLSIFVVRRIEVFAFVTFLSLLLSLWRLLVVDVYVFYRPVSAKALVRRTKGTGSILLYLLRYLVTNKNYLLNTAALCVAAGVLPLLLGQFGGVNVLPLGFAVLCLNTPICILLSCDPGLEQAVRVLPGQAGRFCIRYCLFIFSVNTAVNGVYLVSWRIWHGGVGSMEMISALLIALQSAVLSVWLEWRHPIRNWKIENDLWHHPRKYIVPLIMLMPAGLIGVCSGVIWALLCIVLVECFALMLIVRKK